MGTMKAKKKAKKGVLEKRGTRDERVSKTITYSQDDNVCITRTINKNCNNNCISCINDPDEPSNLDKLDTNDIKMIFSAFDKKAKVIDINGGEPTLRKDIIELLTFLRKRHPAATIQLLTNARMFSQEAFLHKLNSSGVGKMSFIATIYGHEAAVHDAITRAPGSFSQTDAGIKNLIKSGHDVELRIIINKMNYRHLPEIVDYACSNFSRAKRMTLVNLKVTGEASKNRNLVLVPYRAIIPQVVWAIRKHEEMSEKHGETIPPLSLFHFPLCILPEDMRKYAAGVTVDEEQVHFSEQCAICLSRRKCSGLWRSYAEAVGDHELKPIFPAARMVAW